jgi:hypothetical protein
MTSHDTQHFADGAVVRCELLCLLQQLACSDAVAFAGFAQGTLEELVFLRPLGVVGLIRHRRGLGSAHG